MILLKHATGIFCLAALLVSLQFGCSSEKPNPAPTPGVSPGGYGSYGTQVVFQDTVESNSASPEEIASLAFVNPAGKEVNVKDYLGKQNLVMVVTRGFTAPSGAGGSGNTGICLYCSTQTSRLVANYKEFQSRNTEVLVVFPVRAKVDGAHANKLTKGSDNPQPDAEAPFPIVLDLKLEAVQKLGIAADLAKPATYILDADGKVRFAYVGADLTDRPSIKAMLAQLDALNTENKKDSGE